MLYLNGVRIDISKGSSKPVIFVRKFIEEQEEKLGSKKVGNNVYPLKFKFNPKYGVVSEDEEGRPGPKEWPGAKAYANVRNIAAKEDFMAGTWMYSEGVPKKGSDDRFTPVPRHFHMERVTFIDIQRKELIFWLMWVYKSHFGNDFVLENKLGEAREKMRMEQLSLDVRNVIVSNRVLKESQKRDLAALYGVTGAHRNDIDLVMSELLSTINLMERKEGNNGSAFEKFLQKSKFDERTKHEAFIRKCEDEMVVVYEKKENAWYWGTSQNTLGTKITSVTNFDERYAELIDWIITYPETYDKMKEQFEEYAEAD